MECLSKETTKQINGKENKNEKKFKLKNHTSSVVLLSLGMKSSPAFELGEKQMEDVQNWVWTKIRNGELGGTRRGEAYESLSLDRPGSIRGHQSLSRERRKGKGKKGSGGGEEEGEHRKEKR